MNVSFYVTWQRTADKIPENISLHAFATEIIIEWLQTILVVVMKNENARSNT